MITYLKKLFSKNVSKKSYTTLAYGYNQMYGFRRLLPTKALEYYANIAPLYTAIHSIVEEASLLDLTLTETKSKGVVTDHDLLSLLKYPNSDNVQSEFLTQLCTFYKLTGNVFVLATGPVNKAPLELMVINPVNVIINNDNYGNISNMSVMSNNVALNTFYPNEVDGRIRFYSEEGDLELWHIRTFNPRQGMNEHWGMSDLNPILLELEQYYESSIHNLSLLKRGARPSGAIKVSEHLTDDQFSRMQQQLEQFYSGSHNAGRAMVLEGDGDFVEMSTSNKDMDFVQLKRDITNIIYNALKVPLPMISAEYSSYNNLEVAKLNFYDNCVLPLMRRVLEELSVFLLPRYGVFDGSVELSYDASRIDALEPRKNQEIVNLKDSGVLTINELRNKLGFEPLEGGDTLYIPSTNMPLGVDFNDTEELIKNIDYMLDKNNLKQ